MDYPGKVITKTQVTPTQTSASGNWTLDDQAAAIKNNNWPVALVPNPISKSLRFNSADSAYLNRTPASASNRKTWTWSGWVKRTTVNTTGQNLFSTDNGSSTTLGQLFFNDAILEFNCYASSAYQWRLITTQVWRDLSAWYHIVAVVDTTQATSSNRVKLYVNGVQITAFTTATYPSQNFDGAYNLNQPHYVGAAITSSGYLNGYLTEVNFIDGQALTPSSFGMTNPQTGQWIPLKYSGTYGTNGFYLNFKDATSTTTLGYDYSGNANNWTTNNFSVTAGAGNDSLTDVPTPWVAYSTTGDSGGVVRGNYCTLNPLKNVSVSLLNGNLQATYGVGSWVSAQATMPIPKTDKWKYEVIPTTMTYGFLAIVTPSSALTGTSYNNTNNYAWYLDSGEIRYSGTNVVTVTAASANDVCEVRVDNGTVSFYRNGTLQHTYTQKLTDISDDYFPAVYIQSGAVHYYNFGQRPFAYAATGFRSLCTTNLPATAIGFGLTNQGDDYFNTLAYSGTGSNQTLTVGFQPDFAWFKKRSAAESHILQNSIAGNTKFLISNSTAAEDTSSALIQSFNSDGVTIGVSSTINGSSTTYVGWFWKASGSTVTNTAGTITSTVSANTTAGFSVVTYTGTGSNATVGHGLGVAPKMIIVKNRSSATDWAVYHASLPSAAYWLELNSTGGQQGPNAVVFNSTAPTSTVFSVGTNDRTNTNNHVAYCFAAVPGYSAFGSYTGNGSTDGPFVYLGFRPEFVIIKRTDAANNWLMEDSARSTYNAVQDYLLADSSAAEANASSQAVDFLSNGFKPRNTANATNASGGTFIYMAFAESPFQFANAR